MFERLFRGEIDWAQVFLPSTNVVEIVVRGLVMYLIIFALLRLGQKWQASGLSVTDVLVVVLIADAAAPALSGETSSIADGAILVGTIIAVSHLINWLAFRFPRIDRLVHPVPVQLVRDGTMVKRAMNRELVSEKELLTQLRKRGIDNISDAKHVFMEADGSISVIEHETAEGAATARDAAPGTGDSTLPPPEPETPLTRAEEAEAAAMFQKRKDEDRKLALEQNRPG